MVKKCAMGEVIGDDDRCTVCRAGPNQTCGKWVRKAQDAMDKIDARTHVLVPVEPTDEMRRIMAPQWGRVTWQHFEYLMKNLSSDNESENNV